MNTLVRIAALALIVCGNVATAAPPVSKLHAAAELQRDRDTINHALDVELHRLDLVFTGALELEDAKYALENQKLDGDYRRAQLSLADYSTQKGKLLDDHYALHQSLYASELALAKSYAAREEATP